jgi:CRISPR-associated protein Csx14
MADASIPVNLRNPGQVFASLGFLEVAEVLLGGAEGGFDWSDRFNVRFRLRADGTENPVAAVLQFLAEAEIRWCAPSDVFSDNLNPPRSDEEVEDVSKAARATISESFPNREVDRMALPIRLERGARAVSVSHWADGARPDTFKLYAGNRTAYSIARDMLRGKRDTSRKNQTSDALKTKGITSLWADDKQTLIDQPFDVLTPMGGSFNFDPRGGWTAIDAGYSPNEHADHSIAGSPVVEILAACGLEYSRPVVDRREVRYGAWQSCIPPILARAALGGADVTLDIRVFRFTLHLSGKNKVVTFSQEERSHGRSDDWK